MFKVNYINTILTLYISYCDWLVLTAYQPFKDYFMSRSWGNDFIVCSYLQMLWSFFFIWWAGGTRSLRMLIIFVRALVFWDILLCLQLPIIKDYVWVEPDLIHLLYLRYVLVLIAYGIKIRWQKNKIRRQEVHFKRHASFLMCQIWFLGAGIHNPRFYNVFTNFFINSNLIWRDGRSFTSLLVICQNSDLEWIHY